MCSVSDAVYLYNFAPLPLSSATQLKGFRSYSVAVVVASFGSTSDNGIIKVSDSCCVICPDNSVSSSPAIRIKNSIPLKFTDETVLAALIQRLEQRKPGVYAF